MSLKSLYEETNEIYYLINESNQVLRTNPISSPIIKAAENFSGNLATNVTKAARYRANDFAKAVRRSVSSGRFDHVLAETAIFAFSITLGTTIEVAPDLVKDITNNVAVRKEANKQLEEYRKELSVKQALIIQEHQKLIKERVAIKDNNSDEIKTINERIEKMADLIERNKKYLTNAEV